MSEPKSGMSCGMGCWALAAGAGFLTFILLLVLGDYRLMAAIFLSGVLFVVLGFLLSFILCRELPGPAEMAPGSAPTAASKPAKTTPAEAKPDVATASATTDSEAGSGLKPSKPLPGQDDLEARKGSWKYGEEAAEGPGTKPKTMDKAPQGGGDDLKKIKGVGPKLEQVCNEIGIYTFEQIAAWTPAEVEWADENLVGFKGRVSRDNWVDQAKELAAGKT